MSSVVTRRATSCQARNDVARSVCTPQAVSAQRKATNRDMVASAAPGEENTVSRILDIAKKGTVAFAAAVTIGLQAPESAGADSVLRLPISNKKSIAQVQEVMLETWSVVGDSFFDGAALVRVIVCSETSAMSTDTLYSHLRHSCTVSDRLTLRGLHTS